MDICAFTPLLPSVHGIPVQCYLQCLHWCKEDIYCNKKLIVTLTLKSEQQIHQTLLGDYAELPLQEPHLPLDKEG